jgi:dihydroorotate dehydrogenase electron transfer subunit
MSLLTKGKVLCHRQVAPDMFSLGFAAPAVARESKPGQFLQVLTGSTHDPLLRRPLSLFDVEQDKGVITLLYRVVGKGTGLLTGLNVNDPINIMGPLGRGFALPEQPEKVWLIGGGVGIAPLLFLGRVLRDRNCQVRVLGGAANAQGLWAGNRFERLGIPFMAATMDGSDGYTGLVTDLLRSQGNPDEIERIYTCGPEAMMAAVAGYAQENNIWGEVSLEEHMACGVGACLGCARQLKSGDQGYVKVCKDGPVFNMDEVELCRQQG